MAGKPTAQAAGRELAKTKSALDRMREEKTLAQIRDTDFDSLLASLETDGQLLDASQLGEGFHLLQGKAEKKKLVDVPLAILDWQINPGRFGGFVSMKIKTKFPVMFDGQGYTNFIVNDGSTGIKRQIQDMQETGFTGVIVCRKGFRVSEDYKVKEDYVDEHGETKQREILDPATGQPILGTTFYLDTSL
jgi:hypothetical protein